METWDTYIILADEKKATEYCAQSENKAKIKAPGVKIFSSWA